MNEQRSFGAVAGLILAALLLGFFGFLTGGVLAWGGYLPSSPGFNLMGWAVIFGILLPTLLIGSLYLVGRRCR
jgi:hypothetical protein